MTDRQETKDTQVSGAKAGGQAKDVKAAGKVIKSAPTTKIAAANKAAREFAPVAQSAAVKGCRMVGFVALITFLFAVYAAYQTWLTSKQIKNLNQHYRSQEIVQQSQTNKITLMGSEIDTLQINWQQQRQALLAQQRSMDLALQQALEQMAAQAPSQQQLSKWKLAEAEYLLRLANQRLAMEQNPATAVTLLQAADEIMRTSEQLGSYGVRQALAKDISALIAVSVADVEGLYARLAVLLEQSSGLAYIVPTATIVLAGEPVTETITEQPAVALNWDQKVWQVADEILHDTWQELKVLVRVQERTNADQLLAPNIGALLRMRFQLALTQAQSALLRGQQGIYQSSLQQVEGFLRDNHRSTDPVVQAMNKQVAQLSQIQLLAQMPDISGSLYALQDLQAAIHARQGGQ